MNALTLEMMFATLTPLMSFARDRPAVASTASVTAVRVFWLVNPAGPRAPLRSASFLYLLSFLTKIVLRNG